MPGGTIMSKTSLRNWDQSMEYDYQEAAKEEEALEAFRKGKEAKEHNNPHQPGTAEHRYWNEGFSLRDKIK
tara:strand:- start:393 stop:605 length:213 start_codon:yes stop_codon:yes gene_type:complete